MPYLGGTATGILWCASHPLLDKVLSSILLLNMGIFFIPSLNHRYSLRWLPGVIVHLSLFIAAFLWSGSRPTKHSQGHFINFTDGGTSSLYLRLNSIPQQSEKTVSVNARVLAVLKTHDTLIPTKGNLRLVFQKDSLAMGLHYGDLLWLNVRINPVRGPENPSVFNFRRYLSQQDIYHQGSVQNDRINIAGQGGSLIIREANRIREYLGKRLSAYGLAGDELALASAILLGSREDMDQELRQSYADAGVTHILSVSGLHVGVVYLALNFLFFFAARLPAIKKVQPVVILAGIWGYAFLTGLSPSVLRASFMFSMMLIGSGFRRTGNIFNSLAATALILMIIDPFIISRVGFQLSFMAVLGIACFEKKFNSLWKPRHWWADKLWQLVTVSLSAQLGTLPLSLYYFQSFPVYFLPANLVIIPVSSLVIYFGASFYAADQLSLFPALVAGILNIIIKTMNQAAGFFQSLPYSAIRPIYLSEMSMFLLLLMLTALFAAWRHQSFKRHFLLLASACLLMSSLLVRQTKVSHQACLVVYKARGHPTADLVSGRKVIWLCDSSARTGTAPDKFTFGPFRADRGIRSVEPSDLMTSSMSAANREVPLIRFRGRSLFIAGKDWSPRSFSSRISVEYLWVTERVGTSPIDFMKTIRPGTVILDGALPWQEVVRWKTACDSIKSPCHSVRDSGAFVVSW